MQIDDVAHSNGHLCGGENIQSAVPAGAPMDVAGIELTPNHCDGTSGTVATCDVNSSTTTNDTLHNTVQKQPKSPRKAGAPKGNINARKHSARGRIFLGKAPSGLKRQYGNVRQIAKQLKAEWESTFGPMTVSQREALEGAAEWLARSRSWNKWARKPELDKSERNTALDKAAECHDRYINRLRVLGLCKPPAANSSSGSADIWRAFDEARLTAASDAANGHSSLVTQGEGDGNPQCVPDATDDSTTPGKAEQ
jgi:hypothetical protein